MALVEIVRFTDVYEADLAAAFLESYGISVLVTERCQTTVDPLMQRALGIRLMAPASEVTRARDLLARVQTGEFATGEGEDVVETAGSKSWVVGTILAALVAGGGLFWGTGRLRRFRTVHWIGVGLLGPFALFAAAFWISLLIG